MIVIANAYCVRFFFLLPTIIFYIKDLKKSPCENPKENLFGTFEIKDISLAVKTTS